jgi:hypothetical protein
MSPKSLDLLGPLVDLFQETPKYLLFQSSTLVNVFNQSRQFTICLLLVFLESLWDRDWFLSKDGLDF